jgi:hypothetical protein
MAPGVALRVTALAVDEKSPDRLVVATAYGLGTHLAGGGIYESFNQGDEWRKLGEVKDVVNKLTLDGRSIYAATPQGLTRYGDPVEITNPVVMPIPALQPLANPNGLQVAILILTMIMAGLVLVGRIDWLQLRPSHQLAS